VGATVGPYGLLEKLGEGGVGEVWLAKQMQPVRRKVALKIIKAGMDTEQVIARFEAEGQALALMDQARAFLDCSASLTCRTGRQTFSSFVAVLDVALVFLIFKGDVRPN
jgi:serine/threonine protein kinase